MTKRKHLSRLWSGATAAALLLLATVQPLRADASNLAIHVYIDINANLAQDADEPDVPDFAVGVQTENGSVTSAEAYITDAGGNIDAAMPDGEYILAWDVDGQIVHTDFTLPFDINIGLQPAQRLWLPFVGK